MAHDGGGDATSNACDGAMACTSASNCPAQTTVCITDSCESNCCATQNAATGTLCTDSGGRVCNGSGTCVQCNAVSDCPASTTTCKTNTCIANTCGATNAPTGTVCNDSGGLVCDGGGNCVQCNTDSDCLLINDAGTFSCVNHVCQ
jgi:hypothetical protein